jgi:hypothetical protein
VESRRQGNVVAITSIFSMLFEKVTFFNGAGLLWKVSSSLHTNTGIYKLFNAKKN